MIGGILRREMVAPAVPNESGCRCFLLTPPYATFPYICGEAHVDREPDSSLGAWTHLREYRISDRPDRDWCHISLEWVREARLPDRIHGGNGRTGSSRRTNSGAARSGSRVCGSDCVDPGRVDPACSIGARRLYRGCYLDRPSLLGFSCRGPATADNSVHEEPCHLRRPGSPCRDGWWTVQHRSHSARLASMAFVRMATADDGHSG